MAPQKASGPDDRTRDRGPRDFERFGGQLGISNSSIEHARQLVDDLVANGARFEFRPATGMLPASFTYALSRGGDRWKCRGFIVEAKADPHLWSAFVAEIGRRCNGDDG